MSSVQKMQLVITCQSLPLTGAVEVVSVRIKAINAVNSQAAGSNRDNPTNHYPIVGHYMRRWNDEIKEEISTVEVPSPGLAAALAVIRSRKGVQNTKPPEVPTEATSSMAKIMETLAFAQVLNITNQMQQVPVRSSSTLARPLGPPAPSSPIHSNSDSAEVVQQFFEWYIGKHGLKQVEVLEGICEKLVIEDWSLDLLRTEAKGGSMTAEIWSSYGFKLGTLAKLQSKISEFKQTRTSPHNTEDDEL